MPKKCARKERKKKKLCQSAQMQFAVMDVLLDLIHTCTRFKTLMKFLRIIMLNKFLSGISEI